MVNENDEKRQVMEMALSSNVKTLLSPEMEKTLSRFDSSVSNIKETAQEINTALNTSKEIVDNVSVLWSCTLETIKAVKELDVLMKQMDITLEKYLHDTNISLEKFKTSAPILEKQIDNISNRIDRILDKALTIDSKSCEMVDLQLRSQLITQVRDWSEHISSLLMKLMGI
ncbi:MAG: hypothetical protein WC755_09720 [Candidatus Woesearchaeota archaeon]|jgi:hypothetical protein